MASNRVGFANRIIATFASTVKSCRAGQPDNFRPQFLRIYLVGILDAAALHVRRERLPNHNSEQPATDKNAPKANPTDSPVNQFGVETARPPTWNTSKVGR